jgi:type 1 glutamine amidotransferase
MENLNKYTPTELLKLINDQSVLHESIKKEIIDYTIQIDEIEMFINNKINELTVAEKEYIELIEELNNR